MASPDDYLFIYPDMAEEFYANTVPSPGGAGRRACRPAWA